jgi:hypothetical protein
MATAARLTPDADIEPSTRGLKVRCPTRPSSPVASAVSKAIAASMLLMRGRSTAVPEGRGVIFASAIPKGCSANDMSLYSFSAGSVGGSALIG